jgi:hypothetical protein
VDRLALIPPLLFSTPARISLARIPFCTSVTWPSRELAYQLRAEVLSLVNFEFLIFLTPLSEEDAFARHLVRQAA